MTQPDHPCSACPLLDLGHVYPEGDERDPWRRMPRLFAVARSLYGPAMFNHGSRTRLRLEKLMGHWCRVQRTKYGPCTKKRARVCARILNESLAHGLEAPDRPARYAYVQQALKRAVNSEETHAALKATVVQPATPDLALPPILFREVPAA